MERERESACRQPETDRPTNGQKDRPRKRDTLSPTNKKIDKQRKDTDKDRQINRQTKEQTNRI